MRMENPEKIRLFLQTWNFLPAILFGDGNFAV